MLRLLRSLVLVAATTPLAAQIPASEFAARRSALFRQVDLPAVLVLGGAAPLNDYLPWQQSRPFFYLTGFREAESALLMLRGTSGVRTILFVQPKDPAAEVWSGVRLGVEGVRTRLGLEGRAMRELPAVLDSVLGADRRLGVAGDLGAPAEQPSAHQVFVQQLTSRNPSLDLTDVTPVIAALRGVKSAAELERLQVAAEISARGHLAAWRVIQPGVAEFEVQAAAEHVWRREGADGPGYASIVGSGPNATTLHYNASTRIAEAGELLLMDMAASYDGYSADITRTVPVSGRFSPAQRDIYEGVLAAVKAAERQVRAGAPARRMVDSSNAVLRTTLARVGLIDAPDATYDCGSAARPRQCPQIGLYYMHGLGHGIGLDVHDPDQYAESGIIGVGSAFTIEPGIYVRAHLPEIIAATDANRAFLARIAPALARYGGIGVRIEDDYLVTAQGVVRASAGVPRELEEVERAMAEPRTPRDPTVTARFLRLRTGP